MLLASNRPGRSTRTIAIALAGIISASAVLLAQTRAKYETFTATTTNLKVGSGEEIKINVFKWSTENERTELAAALAENSDKGLVDAVEQARAGYIWTRESLGYPLRYAHRETLPGGGERIVLLANRRLGSWSGQPWQAVNQSDSPDYPFTLIELRLNRNGSGEGKMSLTTKVAADRNSGTIALENYDTAPVLLKNVKREPDRAT